MSFVFPKSLESKTEVPLKNGNIFVFVFRSVSFNLQNIAKECAYDT